MAMTSGASEVRNRAMRLEEHMTELPDFSIRLPRGPGAARTRRRS
jgi:hypothetical protein